MASPESIGESSVEKSSPEPPPREIRNVVIVEVDISGYEEDPSKRDTKRESTPPGQSPSPSGNSEGDSAAEMEVDITRKPPATPAIPIPGAVKGTNSSTSTPDAAPVEITEQNGTPDAAPVETTEQNRTPDAAPVEITEQNGTPDAAPVETTEQNGTPDAAPVEITVVVAGKSGAGKSALINSLMKLREDIPLSPDSTTDRHILQCITRGNATFRIIDTPGLREGGREKRKQLKELSRYTNGKADLLIYCIPVAAGNKFTDANPNIMNTLQAVFGSGVWDKCVVVFTFSNLAWNHIQSSNEQEEEAIDKYKAYLNSYAERFQEELRRLKASNNEARTIFTLPPPPAPRQNGDIITIPAIPAGYKEQDRVLADKEDMNWTDKIFLEITNKCKDDRQKMAFLRYRYGEEMAKKMLNQHKGVLLAVPLIATGIAVGSAMGIGGGPPSMIAIGTVGAIVGSIISDIVSRSIATSSSSNN
jgi:GTP-binding protein EngB required for normal cell division